jgi:hypothetical protein
MSHSKTSTKTKIARALLVEEAGVLAVQEIDGRGIGGAMPGEQAFRLLLVCGKG